MGCLCEIDAATKEVRLSLDGDDPMQRWIDVHLLPAQGAEAERVKRQGRGVWRLSGLRWKIAGTWVLDFGKGRGR